MTQDKPRMTPEEFLWWLVKIRTGLTEEEIRNDPAIQQIVQEEADKRNEEVIGRVMEALAKNRSARNVTMFVPSDNYRRCRWGDRPEYRFNKSQALMVKALHENFLQGGIGLSAGKLFAAAGLRRHDKRVEHVFRRIKSGKEIKHPALIDGLIFNEGGVWRLNLDDTK